MNPQNSRVYGLHSKSNIQDSRLFHRTNWQSKKVMVPACVIWNSGTKPFFVNDRGLKVNSKSYKKHLEKELLPEVDRVMQNNT